MSTKSKRDTVAVTSVNTSPSSQVETAFKGSNKLLVWTHKKGKSHAGKMKYVLVGVAGKSRETGVAKTTAATGERRLSSASKNVWAEEDLSKGHSEDIVYVPRALYQSFLDHFPNFYNAGGLNKTQLSSEGIDIYITGPPNDVIKNLTGTGVLPKGATEAAKKAWLNDVGFNRNNYQDETHRDRYEALVRAEKQPKDTEVINTDRTFRIMAIAAAIKSTPGQVEVLDESGNSVGTYGNTKTPTHPIVHAFTRQAFKWTDKKSVDISHIVSAKGGKIALPAQYSSSTNEKGVTIYHGGKRPVRLGFRVTNLKTGEKVEIPEVWSDRVDALDVLLAEIESINKGNAYSISIIGNVETARSALATELKAIKDKKLNRDKAPASKQKFPNPDITGTRMKK